MGLFSFLKKDKTPSIGYDVLAVDCHSHLIPAVDDGSQSVQESMGLLQAFHDRGFKKIITTPHVMADGYRNSTQTLKAGLHSVREALVNSGIPIEIELAAEYFMDSEFQKRLQSEDILVMGDNYVLFELSYLNEPRNLQEVVFELQSAGYRPMLAHPERYPYYHSSNTDKYKKLKDFGISFQLNIPSLAGHYGKPVGKIAEMLLADDLVEFVATDLHKKRHFDSLDAALNNSAFQQLLASQKLKNSEL